MTIGRQLQHCRSVTTRTKESNFACATQTLTVREREFACGEALGQYRPCLHTVRSTPCMAMPRYAKIRAISIGEQCTFGVGQCCEGCPCCIWPKQGCCVHEVCKPVDISLLSQSHISPYIRTEPQRANAKERTLFSVSLAKGHSEKCGYLEQGGSRLLRARSQQ